MIPQACPVPVVETARLVLRGPNDSDVVALAAFLVSPRAAWIGGPFPDEDAAEWLSWQRAQWAEHGRGLWIMALQQDDRPIGRVGLLEHGGWPEPELSWFLFEGFEGQGLASEAALAARSYANRQLGLPSLASFIEPTNKRSRALAERLGATPECDALLEGVALTVYRHPSHDEVLA